MTMLLVLEQCSGCRWLVVDHFLVYLMWCHAGRFVKIDPVTSDTSEVACHLTSSPKLNVCSLLLSKHGLFSASVQAETFVS